MQENMRRPLVHGFLWRHLDQFEAALEEAISRLSQDLAPQAQVLGLGTSPETYAGWFSQHRYVAVDLWTGEPEEKRRPAELVASLANLPFPAESFDACVSVAALEHTVEPGGALREMARALRPRGRLLLIAPQEREVHQAPHDYFRFTRYGLRYLLQEAGFVDIRILPVGGFFRLLARRLLNARRFFRGLWKAPAALVVVPLALLLPVFDGLDRDRNFTLGYICAARKH
jgi:SAM-dependent methyltransferase